MEPWRKRSKRWQDANLRALGALYGDVTPPTPMPAPKTPNVPVKRKVRIPERSIQVALVTWAQEQGLPLISIPNEGQRNAWAGRRMVDMGLTRGVSDLLLAMPGKRGEHGFWIELKSLGKKPRPEQWAWLIKMREQGYRAEYYDSFEAAKAAILAYVDLN